MCKVFFVAGIKKQHQDKVKKLSIEMIKEVSSTDGDGFGYAAITRTGQVYGEKWLRKEDAFVLHSQPKVSSAGIMVKDLLGEAAKMAEEPVSEKVYDSFGTVRTKDVVNNTVAVIIHARNSTVGGKSIENTHPFFEPESDKTTDTALVHNGGILNHTSLTKKTSTCDSEVILHQYLKHNMSFNPWGITELSKDLVGAYTVGVLTSTYENDQIKPVLDIFKSNKDLYCAYVKEIETFVFCTTKWALERIIKAAGMTCGGIAEVRDGYFLRFDAITGLRLDEPVSFNLSRQYQNSYMDNHHRHTSHSDNATVLPVRNVTTNTQSAKESFETKHADLFLGKYYDVSTGLTKEEQEYYDLLAKDDKTDVKALRLVKKVMGM